MPLSDHPTIVHAFFASVDALGHRTAILHKAGGSWKSLRWKEFGERVTSIARGLVASGVKPGDRVGIFFQTRYEWTLIDLAILAAGGVTVPIYPTLNKEQVSFMVSQSGMRILFIDKETRHRLPNMQGVEIFSCDGSEGNVRGIEHIEERAERDDSSTSQDVWKNLSLGDPATIVYTSGTTGQQKGVVLSHANVMAEVTAVNSLFSFAPDDIGFVILPLPHVLGRAQQYYQLAAGLTNAYAESITTIADDLKAVRPHFTVGVPRMLEKIYERIFETVAASSPFKQSLFRWACDIALHRVEFVRRRRSVPFKTRLLFPVADFLVCRKIRQRLGGRLRIFVSGGAPLRKDIAKFLSAMGVLILEGYGLTETFAAVIVNRPDDYNFGTIGKPLPGVHVRLADDGELLLKGPMVFQEYFLQPNETKAAFDKEGWFRSGDIGEYSKEGFLRITDRKKDIIVTAAGKKVAPQPIERMLSESPYVDMAMVYGDRHKYLVALITVNASMVSTMPPSRVHEIIEKEVEAVNKRLSSFETIKKFSILPGSFTIEGGELTPTLKIRRKEASQKYAAVLEKMYQE